MQRSSCSRESRCPAWRRSTMPESPAPALHRGQLEDAQDGRGDVGLRRRAAARDRGRRRGRRRPVRPVHRADGRGGRSDGRQRRDRVRAEHAPGGLGRVHRRGLRADAHSTCTCAAWCSATRSGASTTTRPTAPWPGEGPGRARGRAPADPLRRRDGGGARARRDAAQAAPPGPGGARARCPTTGSPTS